MPDADATDATPPCVVPSMPTRVRRPTHARHDAGVTLARTGCRDRCAGRTEPAPARSRSGSAGDTYSNVTLDGEQVTSADQQAQDPRRGSRTRSSSSIPTTQRGLLDTQAIDDRRRRAPRCSPARALGREVAQLAPLVDDAVLALGVARDRAHRDLRIVREEQPAVARERDRRAASAFSSISSSG